MQKSWGEPIRAGYSENRRWERLSIEIPSRFRQPGQTVWREGITANISSGGVLLIADRLMEVRAPIHMSYVLPATIAGMRGLAVGCKGEIVRVKAPTTRDGTFLFAVKILDYYPGMQWKPDLRRIVGGDRGVAK